MGWGFPGERGLGRVDSLFAHLVALLGGGEKGDLVVVGFLIG